MKTSSDSWNMMEHSKTFSQQPIYPTAFFTDSKCLSFGAMLHVC